MSDVTDSPVGWVNAHVRRYVESGGASGHRWSGTDTLLLTTRGRRTGLLRRTALIYGRDDDRFVVVGSNGGKAVHASPPPRIFQCWSRPGASADTEADSG